MPHSISLLIFDLFVVDDATTARIDPQSGSVTVGKPAKTLDALRISFANDQGWNLATLGRYQQARSRAYTLLLFMESIVGLACLLFG